MFVGDTLGGPRGAAESTVLRCAADRNTRKKPGKNDLKVSAVQNKALRELLLCKPIA